MIMFELLINVFTKYTISTLMNFKKIPDIIASFLDESDINQFIQSGLVKFIVYKTFLRILHYECSDSYYNSDFMNLACQCILVGLIRQFANHIVKHTIDNKPTNYEFKLVLEATNLHLTNKRLPQTCH